MAGRQRSGAEDVPQITTPAYTPAAGRQLVYAKSDGVLYVKSSAGVETPIGLQRKGAANVYSLTDPTNDSVASITVVDDNSATAGWANRLRLFFQVFGGSAKLVQWWNEYGEWRGTPAKANTVGWRLHARDQLADGAHVGDVLNVQLARNDTTNLFSVDEATCKMNSATVAGNASVGGSLTVGGSPLDDRIDDRGLLRVHRGYAIPKVASNAIDTLGTTVPTATGTLTAANPATTNKHTRIRRADYLVTVAATTAVAGYRMPTARLLRGASAGVGGFRSIQIAGPATGVSVTTSRFFLGLAASVAAPTDVEPSTQVSCIGIGYDAADTNVQLMHNDAAGVCTKVDLGASWPVPTADRTDMYWFECWAAPNESKLNYKIVNLSSGVTVTGDTGVSTNIPAGGTYLAERGYMSVGGTSSVVGLAFGGLDFELETLF